MSTANFLECKFAKIDYPPSPRSVCMNVASARLAEAFGEAGGMFALQALNTMGLRLGSIGCIIPSYGEF